MEILVIHEKDLTDYKEIVIGVADSVENAEKLIEEYYGKDEIKEISYRDIRDSNIQYIKVIEVPGILGDKPYRVQITLEWFELNKG